MQLSISFLLLFPHPGAISPMGAISRMITVGQTQPYLELREHRIDGILRILSSTSEPFSVDRAQYSYTKFAFRPILLQSDRWIEKGDFRSKTKSCIVTESTKCLFDPNFFDRAIRSAHPVEKVDFLNGMHGSDCSFENVFEAHHISHHPQ